MGQKNKALSGPAVIPRDILLGLTKPEDVGFRLRWGIIGGGEISRQFVLSSRACPGATISAVATGSLAVSYTHLRAHET